MIYYINTVQHLHCNICIDWRQQRSSYKSQKTRKGEIARIPPTVVKKESQLSFSTALTSRDSSATAHCRNVVHLFDISHACQTTTVCGFLTADRVSRTVLRARCIICTPNETGEIDASNLTCGRRQGRG